MVERLPDTVGACWPIPVTFGPNSRRKYTDLAKAQTAFSNIIGEVWSKPKRMVRSASYTNLTYYKEAQHDYPIKVVGVGHSPPDCDDNRKCFQKSPSVSSLAPSLALPQYYRQAERIVHTERVYKPFIYDWSDNVSDFVKFPELCRQVQQGLQSAPPH